MTKCSHFRRQKRQTLENQFLFLEEFSSRINIYCKGSWQLPQGIIIISAWTFISPPLIQTLRVGEVTTKPIVHGIWNGSSQCLIFYIFIICAFHTSVPSACHYDYSKLMSNDNLRPTESYELTNTLPVDLSRPICTTGVTACCIIDLIVWPFSIRPQGRKPIAD